MRTLFLSLLIACGLSAQSINYPSSLDTDSSLFVTADNVQTVLTVGMLVGDNVAIVQSSSGFSVNMIATICEVVDSSGVCTTWEHMLVANVNGNVLTVTRGFAGTTPIAHAVGKIVAILIDSAHQKVLKNAVIALESAVGTGATGRSSSYNFPAQSPSGTLSAGNNTITMAPVPLGVNGTDTQHSLRVAGTGTPEACPITGGSGTSGAPSGTIIINCAGSHPAGFTVSSASSGIREAASALGNQGTVVMPIGSLPIYGTLVLPTAVALVGQGSSTSSGTLNTVLACAAAANPCLVFADGLGSAANQGMGGGSNFQLYGAGSGTGLWIGGDPASVFAPSAWTGSYLRFDNIISMNFTTALEHRHGNFVVYRDSEFNGLTTAFYIPSDAGGETQPLEFYSTVLTVPSGNAVQMDSNGFLSCPVQYFGGQVSGMITGAAVDWDSQGTHYEPNAANVGVFNITAGGSLHRVRVSGGIISVHGTSLAAAFNLTGANIYANVKDLWLQADVGMTVTNFVNYATSSGSLSIQNIDIASAGAFTNLYSYTGSPLNLWVAQGFNSANSPQVTAAATTAFPAMNYPVSQTLTIAGATVGGSGITAVSGLLAGQSGTLSTTNPQTFTAGGTIGNTFTTVAGVPYTYRQDGTKIWVH